MTDATPGGVVAQARAERDAGAAWRARDLLAAHVETEADPHALALLADVLHGMGDLPRAGAVWFAVGAKGPEVDAAVAAWREQSRDDFAVMWRSLPASVRAEPRARRLEALRERALAQEGQERSEGPATDPDAGQDDDSGFDLSWLVAWTLAIAFVVFAVIGFVTVLGWVVPG